ncbi:unnamed protein product [Closterium sp. NIES-53]
MLLAFYALSCPTDPPVLQCLPSSASCVCPLPASICGYYRVNPCSGGTCINHGMEDWTCVCQPSHRSHGSSCDLDWEAISSITVAGSDWRCKDVYTMYGLTLQQFTAMNPGINCSALLPHGRELEVKELLPACSAFYYVQPNDTCSSVAQFLNITEESLQQLNPDGPEERGGRGAGGSGEAHAQGQPRDSAMAPVQQSVGPSRDDPRVFGLDKFNGDNFAEWSFRMENVFDH